MHLESVASCKASLQMKGGQQKEEVKGRKQSEKKYRHKRRGGGGGREAKKRVKKIKFSRGKVENRREKSRSPSGRDAAMRGGFASALPCPAASQGGTDRDMRLCG